MCCASADSRAMQGTLFSSDAGFDRQNHLRKINRQVHVAGIGHVRALWPGGHPAHWNRHCQSSRVLFATLASGCKLALIVLSSLLPPLNGNPKRKPLNSPRPTNHMKCPPFQASIAALLIRSGTVLPAALPTPFFRSPVPIDSGTPEGQVHGLCPQEGAGPLVGVPQLAGSPGGLAESPKTPGFVLGKIKRNTGKPAPPAGLQLFSRAL
jgi:hypothetical protein